MKGIILIFILALLPFLLYLAAIRKAKRRFQSRMGRIRTSMAYEERGSNEIDDFASDNSNPELSHPYSDVFRQPGESLGDVSCRFNARSPYLRCAVNPSGPCENCPYYDRDRHDRKK